MGDVQSASPCFPSSIFDPRSSVLTRASSAGTREVQFQIVSFGVEHINRVAAVALDTAMKLTKILGGLERVVVVFPGHIEGLVKNTVFIQRVALDGPRPLEQHHVVAAATKPIELPRHAVNRKGV